VVDHSNHLAQQQLRYEIDKKLIKRYTKTAIVLPQNCKFSSATGASLPDPWLCPQTSRAMPPEAESYDPRPPAAGDFALKPPCWIFKTFSSLGPSPFEIPACATGTRTESILNSLTYNPLTVS